MCLGLKRMTADRYDFKGILNWKLWKNNSSFLLLNALTRHVIQTEQPGDTSFSWSYDWWVTAQTLEPLPPQVFIAFMYDPSTLQFSKCRLYCQKELKKAFSTRLWIYVTLFGFTAHLIIWKVTKDTWTQRSLTCGFYVLYGLSWNLCCISNWWKATFILSTWSKTHKHAMYSSGAFVLKVWPHSIWCFHCFSFTLLIVICHRA